MFLTIVNDGSAPTGTYDQKVVFDSAQYASLINANWTNGRAAYVANGTSIYLWLEANATNASSHTILWLRLYSIPVAGQVVVGFSFAPKSSFLLSEEGFTGENPLLSSVYGEFDNGARVFDFYDNFSGTSLTGQWAHSGTWTYSVNDGIGITGIPGTGGGIYSTAKFTFPETVDFYGNLFQIFTATSFLDEGIGTSACTGCGTASTVGFDAGGGSAWAGPAPLIGVGSGATVGSPAFSKQTFATFTSIAESSSAAEFLVNYSAAGSFSTTLPSSPLPVGLAMSGNPSGSTSSTQTTYWIRERATANTSVTSTQAFVPPPVSLAALPGTLIVGESLTLITQTSGWPAAIYTYSGLPTGCVSASLPSLSCVVRAAGQYTPTVVVSDLLGDSAQASTNLTVAAPGTSGAPPPLTVQLASAPSSVPVNESLTLIAEANGGTPPLSYAYSGLPPGCASLNQFYVSCQPDLAGTYTATVTVTDAAANTSSASAVVTVTPVVAPSPPALKVSLTSIDGPLLAGSPLLLVASASGGVGPYSYAYSGLPAGCESADASSIACTPTATGPFLIAVVVTDGASSTASASTSLTLATSPTPPTTTSSTGISSTEWLEIEAGVAAAILLGAVALARSFGGGRRRPPTAAP